jgi:hypothetical protein
MLLGTISALAASRPQFDVVPLIGDASNVLGFSTNLPGPSLNLRINNSNQVAGTLVIRTGGSHFESYLWSNGNLQMLGNGRIEDINDAGAYIGSAPGSVFQSEFVHGINNAGQVVGEDPHPFLWDSNGFRYFPFNGVAGQAYVRAVNNFGVATGGAISNNSYQAFIFTVSNVVDIGQIPKISLSEGKAISDQGHVVLTATYTNRSTKRIRSYLYHDNRLTRLPTLPGNPHTWAQSMNNSDEIVGFIGPTAHSFGTNAPFAVAQAAGFLYSRGKLYNLNKLLTKSSRGWHVSNALDINDAGTIVAHARRPFEPEQPVLLRRVMR